MFRTLTTGTVVTKAYSEGLMIVFPWNRVYLYDTRIQETNFKVNVLSLNGLTIQTDVSMRYHPTPERVGELHKRVGPNYKERILQPVITESVREVVGGFRPEDLYSTHRHVLAEKIKAEARRELNKFPLILDGFVVQNVVLPSSINQAIEEKISQQQMHLAYEFILRRAKQEIERKSLEAEGIKKYNEIVNSSLTPTLLRWLGIQATKELAESPNAKVLLFGGKDGLPVILNLEDSASAKAPAPSSSGIQSRIRNMEAPAGLSREIAPSTGLESPLPTRPSNIRPGGAARLPLSPEAPVNVIRKPETPPAQADQ